MVWTTRNEAFTILQTEMSTLKKDIARKEDRVFHTILALLALYGVFFVANIAFLFKGNAIWLTLLIIGGLWFVYSFCLSLVSSFKLRSIPEEMIKEIFLRETELSIAVMISTLLFVISSFFVIVSFIAIEIPFSDWRYILFIVLLIFILFMHILTFVIYLKHPLFKKLSHIAKTDKFPAVLIESILKSKKLIIPVIVIMVVPLVLLSIGIFINVYYYWPSGPLSSNFLVFLIFAQIATVTLLLYITTTLVDKRIKQNNANELASRIRNLIGSPEVDLNEMLKWYDNFIKQS